MTSLVHAVNLLECFRVVLLQRPAMLYPSSVLGDLSAIFHGQGSMDSTLSLLRSFISYEKRDVQVDSPASSLQSLCALSLLGSHTRRLPGSLSRYLESSEGQYQGSLQGWRQEFLELALQRWLASHADQPTADTLLLYHTVHLSLYANFARIGRSAHLTLTENPSVTDRVHKIGNNLDRRFSSQQEPGSSRRQTSCTEKCFTSEEDQEKAIWHASRILRMAKEIKGDSVSNLNERVHLLRQAEKADVGMATHYSYAIYYASMVLWWSIKFNNQLRPPGRQSDEEKSTAVKQSLRQGIDLLSRSASKIADVFKQILASLESRG